MLHSPLLRRTLLTTLLSSVAIAALLMLGGAEVRSEEPPPGIAARKAPQGLVFLRESGRDADLWLADPQGQNPRKLISGVINFDLRPGGSELVYMGQHEDFSTSIVVLDLASGVTRTLVAEQNALSLSPIWSPADGIIAYERRTISASGGGAPKIFLIATDGTPLGPIIPGAEVITYGAVWSHDGTRLAAIDPIRNGVVIFNFSSETRLLPVRDVTDIDWSPDGKRLAVSAQTVTNGRPANRLVLYDLETDTQTMLTADPQFSDYMPRWSPDGSQIAFVRRSELHVNGEIWVLPLDADGQAGPVRAITSDPTFDNYDPQWSPDGTRLIWDRRPLGGPTMTPSIWQIAVDDPAATPQLLIESAMTGRWIK